MSQRLTLTQTTGYAPRHGHAIAHTHRGRPDRPWCGCPSLGEAFASQALYCRDFLGIDPDLFNPNGGGIAVGHPYGMTGARLVGQTWRPAGSSVTSSSVHVSRTRAPTRSGAGKRSLLTP